MSKLIIQRDTEVVQTVQLSRERLTLGRHRHNDIVLSHPTVSGEHAVIETIANDSFLEDLSSTNGTFVNGHRIGKHFLQHGDKISLAKFQIEFIADGVRPFSAAAQPVLAHIRILNGNNAGKQLTLEKLQTTLGRAGVQVVQITRHPDMYTIVLVEGEQAPLVNGVKLGRLAQSLRTGDVIDLTGTQMVFTLAAP